MSDHKEKENNTNDIVSNVVLATVCTGAAAAVVVTAVHTAPVMATIAGVKLATGVFKAIFD